MIDARRGDGIRRDRRDGSGATRLDCPDSCGSASRGDRSFATVGNPEARKASGRPLPTSAATCFSIHLGDIVIIANRVDNGQRRCRFARVPPAIRIGLPSWGQRSIRAVTFENPLLPPHYSQPPVNPAHRSPVTM